MMLVASTYVGTATKKLSASSPPVSKVLPFAFLSDAVGSPLLQMYLSFFKRNGQKGKYAPVLLSTRTHDCQQFRVVLFVYHRLRSISALSGLFTAQPTHPCLLISSLQLNENEASIGISIGIGTC